MPHEIGGHKGQDRGDPDGIRRQPSFGFINGGEGDRPKTKIENLMGKLKKGIPNLGIHPTAHAFKDNHDAKARGRQHEDTKTVQQGTIVFWNVHLGTGLARRCVAGSMQNDQEETQRNPKEKDGREQVTDKGSLQ